MLYAVESADFLYCRLTESGCTAFDDYRERLKRAIDTMPEEGFAEEGGTPGNLVR